MTVVTIFLVLIFLLLVAGLVGAFLAWQKISVFLTWNTRYNTADYEKAVTQPKFRKPSAPASQTEQRGRSIKPVDDLVDLENLDFETAYKAVGGEE